jgi:hypothetical protein
LYAQGEVSQLDTVHLDRTIGAEYLHSEALLNMLRLELNQMQRMALSPEGTRDLINSIAHQL